MSVLRVPVSQRCVGNVVPGTQRPINSVTPIKNTTKGYRAADRKYFSVFLKSYSVVTSLNSPASIVCGLLYRRGQQKIEISPPTVEREGPEKKEPRPRALTDAHTYTKSARLPNVELVPHHRGGRNITVFTGVNAWSNFTRFWSLRKPMTHPVEYDSLKVTRLFSLSFGWEIAPQVCRAGWSSGVGTTSFPIPILCFWKVTCLSHRWIAP